MSDDHDATGEGRKADPERSDSTDADESGAVETVSDGVDEPGSIDADDVTPGGDAGVTADMVEAAEAEALAEAEADADVARGPTRSPAQSAAAATARWSVPPPGRPGPPPASRPSAPARPRRRATATAPRTGRQDRGNIFTRFARFLREVVAELRKVIWPTRKEMITYTVVVIVFVVFMVALVAGLDVLFAKGVLTVFG